MKKRTILLLAAPVVLFIVMLIFLWTNLDWIVQRAIERYGSQATGTVVSVDAVSLRPAQGRGEINGVTVANPPGFSSPHVLSLGGIVVGLSPKTVASNPVVIDDIRITAPLVVYEKNAAGSANVDVIRRSLGANEASARRKQEAKPASKNDAKRIRIKRLVIENAKVEVRIAALGERPRTLRLSRLEMNDLGGRNGASPDKIGSEVLSAILAEASRTVGKAGASLLLEKGLDRLFRRK